VVPGKLWKEIEQTAKTLPPYINRAMLDAVRHFGNFGAHPEKEAATGEVIDVEPGEAEWCLDILETLFEFYFVQPHDLEQKLARLEEKRQSTKTSDQKKVGEASGPQEA